MHVVVHQPNFQIWLFSVCFVTEQSFSKMKDSIFSGYTRWTLRTQNVISYTELHFQVRNYSFSHPLKSYIHTTHPADLNNFNSQTFLLSLLFFFLLIYSYSFWTHWLLNMKNWRWKKGPWLAWQDGDAWISMVGRQRWVVSVIFVKIWA